jgi:hypothetical protein
MEINFMISQGEEQVLETDFLLYFVSESYRLLYCKCTIDPDVKNDSVMHCL